MIRAEILAGLALVVNSWSAVCPGSQEQTAQLIVAAMDAGARDARADAPSPELATGPLLIDFASLLRALPDSGLLVRELQRNASMRAFRATSETSAIRCTQTVVESCGIVDDGVLVKLDRIWVADEVADAITISIVTLARGTTHTAVCSRRLLLKFRREGRQWVQTEQSILSQC